MTRIHIFGASGSGTTTLGKALADTLQCRHYDTDTYFWMPTDPPFQAVRECKARQALLRHDLAQCDSWVLSGSLCGWGDFAIPMFSLVVFLWLPSAIRMQRLEKREVQRYGHSIEDPHDPRYATHRAFLDWAAEYDAGGLDMRSRARHEEWMKGLPCKVVRLEQSRTVQDNLKLILGEMSNQSR